MEIERGCISCLTIRQPGALFAVAEHQRDLEARPVQLDQLVTVQSQVGRGEENRARLGRVFLIDQHHHTQTPLEGDVPDQRRIHLHMGGLGQCPQSVEAAQVLPVDFAVILAARPFALGMRTGREKPAVGVAPQFGNGVQIETDDFINIFLLRIVAIHTMIVDARWQAMSMLAQLLLVEIHPCRFFFLCGRRPSGWRCLGAGDREGAAARDIHDGERGDLQAAFGTGGTAVEEVPQPERLLATLRHEGRILR